MDDHRSRFGHLDDVIERAGRRADLAARRAAGPGGPWPPAFVGVLFVAMGVLLLLDNLDILDGRYVLRTYWPALIVAWGLVWAAMGRGGQRLSGVLAMGVGGLLVANNALGWGVRIWDLFWPLVIISIGVHILLSATGSRRHAAVEAEPGEGIPPPLPETDLSSLLHVTAITANIARKNASQTFVGGSLTVALGGLELDLRECRMAEASAEIMITVNMGNLEIFIPKEWAVESHLRTALGNFEDRSDRPIDPAAKRVVLRGYAFLGNVEVRN